VHSVLSNLVVDNKGRNQHLHRLDQPGHFLGKNHRGSWRSGMARPIRRSLLIVKTESTEWCNTNLTSPLSIPKPKAAQGCQLPCTAKYQGSPIVAQTTLIFPCRQFLCKVSWKRISDGLALLWWGTTFSEAEQSAWYIPVLIFPLETSLRPSATDSASCRG
jgi:hypothetical protein